MRGHARGATTVALPPANPIAVGKMVQGVQAAKDGQRERAVALLREAIALDSNLWEARYDLGVVLASAGDLAGAEEQLATAAKLAPDSQDVAVGARPRCGGVAASTRLAADGLADFVHDHPNAVDARTLYVAALRESGQIDKAIAEAREVLVRKPADATALAELALSHLAKGEKEAAALLAKQALDANPNSAVAHRATGLLDLANGDDAEAFAEFRKASQADPHDTTSRLNMGVVLLQAGAYAKAEEQYREILKVSPDDVEAQVGLAAALRGEADAQHPQKLEEARALLEKVLAGRPARHERRSSTWACSTPTSSSARRDARAALQAVPLRRAQRPPASRRGREVRLGRVGGERPPPPPPAPSPPTPAPATPPAPPEPPPAKK